MYEFEYKGVKLNVIEFSDNPESRILLQGRVIGFKELVDALGQPEADIRKCLLTSDVVSLEPLRFSLDETLLGIRVSGLIGYLTTKGGNSNGK